MPELVDEDQEPERHDEGDDGDDGCGDGHAVLLAYHGPCGHRVVVVREDEREEQAVQAIEDATVPGDNPARVLGAEGALERRLAEVAELRRGRAIASATPDGLRQAGARGRRPARQISADEHGAGERAERALDGLARAHGGHELAAPAGPPGEVPPESEPMAV